MASTTFNTLETLHILGAMVVVGYLAVIPMWRAALKKDAEPAILRGFLSTVTSVQQRVVLPALGLVILTGIVMTTGSIGAAEAYDLSRTRMAQTGLIIGLVLGFVLWSGLGGPSKKMLSLVEKGEHAGPAMTKLWGDWRVALLAASALAIAATTVMVFSQPLR